jgi:streptomycin 6-kinase
MDAEPALPRLPPLPALLPAKARALGAAGAAWLHGLPGLVRELEERWDLIVLEPLEGGTEAFVATVRRHDGSDAVLKVGLPVEAFGVEVDTLLRADGTGYVRVLAHDRDRTAVLLERLGRSLDQTGLSPSQQLATLCRLLPHAWTVPRPADGGVPVDKAAELSSFIESTWGQLGEPASVSVRDRALRYAQRRGRALDADRCVVVHGDAAASNALEVPAPRDGAETGFVFVDPDGFVGDPAYDVGVALRDWCAELSASEHPRSTAMEWSRLLADGSGRDPDEVWEWAFVERVSTGLYCVALGADDAGRAFLTTAEALL